MSQRVPHFDTDEHTNVINNPSLLIHAGLSHHPEASHVLIRENEMAELTWENGQLSMQGLVHARTGKPGPTGTGTGTLESLVDQATRAQLLPFPSAPVPWPPRQVPPSAAAVDAVVPCSSLPHVDPHPGASGFVGSSGGGQRERAGEASQGSAGPTLDTCEEVEVTTTSASPSLREEGEGGDGSPDTENTSFAGGQPQTVDEHDYVGHSWRSNSKRARDDDEKASKGKAGRSTISTKKSRAAAVHNQSERKRRDRINQKMRTLQKLVPNSSKIDKASMLDEVIEYLKQLQAQVQMMSRMGSISPLMMPMNMQQLQISMMAQMAHLTQMAQMAQMGMGMMDLNAVGRPAGNTGMPSHVLPPSGVLPVFSPAAFFPMNAAPCDLSAAERMQPSTAAMFADPFSAMHHACPTQPMSMDVYNRMAALYQQIYQQNAGAKYS